MQPSDAGRRDRSTFTPGTHEEELGDKEEIREVPRAEETKLYQWITQCKYDSSVIAATDCPVLEHDALPSATICRANAQAHVKCSPEKSDDCTNRIPRSDITDCTVIHTSSTGYGLRTNVDMTMGTEIGEFVGIVHRERDSLSTHVFDMAGVGYIDATQEGNRLRFINASCKPNCVADSWDWGGRKHIVISALDRIARGTELTLAYALNGLRYCTTRDCGDCTKWFPNPIEQVLLEHVMVLNPQPLSVDVLVSALSRDMDESFAGKWTIPVQGLRHTLQRKLDQHGRDRKRVSGDLHPQVLRTSDDTVARD